MNGPEIFSVVGVCMKGHVSEVADVGRVVGRLHRKSSADGGELAFAEGRVFRFGTKLVVRVR